MKLKIKLHNECAKFKDGYTGVDSYVEMDGYPALWLQGLSFGMDADSLTVDMSTISLLTHVEFETDHHNNAIPGRITFTEDDRVLEIPVLLKWPEPVEKELGPKSRSYYMADPLEIKVLHGDTLQEICNVKSFGFGTAIDDLVVYADIVCLGKFAELQTLTPVYTLGSCDPRSFNKRITRI